MDFENGKRANVRALRHMVMDSSPIILYMYYTCHIIRTHLIQNSAYYAPVIDISVFQCMLIITIHFI